MRTCLVHLMCCLNISRKISSAIHRWDCWEKRYFCLLAKCIDTGGRWPFATPLQLQHCSQRARSRSIRITRVVNFHFFFFTRIQFTKCGDDGTSYYVISTSRKRGLKRSRAVELFPRRVHIIIIIIHIYGEDFSSLLFFPE